MKRSRHIGLASALALMLAGCGAEDSQPGGTPQREALREQCLTNIGAEVWIPGGVFTLGDDAGYPEERGAREVRVDGFWVDAHEVTNAQFEEFVEATGYVSVAERAPDLSMFPDAPDEMRQPGSAVFTPPGEAGLNANWWRYIPGANWRHPEGPDSTIEGRDHHPVVHIAYEDAKAYADWAGRALPNEAQFERAARAGLEGERYAWGGEDLAPGGVHLANTWQGLFPFNNSTEDGFVGASPVGCFPANGFGVFDLIGNAWEWTSSWYAPGHSEGAAETPIGPAQSESFDPNNPSAPSRVIKGGSYLCAPNYCMRYRPAARQAQDVTLSTNHIGFRTISTDAGRDRAE